jgi:hypothetical protein
VQYLGADVNQACMHLDPENGMTPLCIAAASSSLKMIKYLAKELGADVNHASPEGVTPLMIASVHKDTEIVVWLVKAGANPQASYKHTDLIEYIVKAGIQPSASFVHGTVCNAADISREAKATAEQIAYLDAKAHCSSYPCSGAGLLKCTGCKQARYCGQQCQVAHWKAHKADCKRWSAKLAASKGSKLT